MELVRDAPSASSFVALSTHQSQTPESFFNGPAVLYHHSPSAKLAIQASELHLAPSLSRLFEEESPSVNGRGSSTNGDTELDEREIVVEGVDVWVTSERFILFSQSNSSGVSIPYPTISLHAIQRSSPTSAPSLFLQILTQSPTFDDYDPDATVSFSLIPCIGNQVQHSQSPTVDQSASANSVEEQPQDPIQQLYDALSACANLHPDPASPGSDAEEGDGGGPNIMFEGDAGEAYTTLAGIGGQQTALPPPMPGSGGWITADNVGDYFDEDGNWRGQSLGEGAGSVRRREDDGRVNGTGHGDPVESEESEPSAEAEETKWRRTG